MLPATITIMRLWHTAFTDKHKRLMLYPFKRYHSSTILHILCSQDTLPDWLRDLVNNTNNIYLDLSYNAINQLDRKVVILKTILFDRLVYYASDVCKFHMNKERLPFQFFNISDIYLRRKCN